MTARESTPSELSVIVGGGSGLGFAIARRMLETDAVLLLGRNEEKLRMAKGVLGGTNVHIRAGDMSKASVVEEAFDFAGSLGSVTTKVFCCAGDPAFAPVGSIRDGDIADAFNGNLISAILCAQEGVRSFRKSGTYGRIVAILSTAAQVTREKEPLYSAAKWGARAFFLSLREATKKEGIEVMAVYPGGMKTPFWERDKHLGPNTEAFMDPADVADAIVSALCQSRAIVSELVLQRPTHGS